MMPNIFLKNNRHIFIWSGLFLLVLVVAGFWLTRDMRLDRADINMLNEAQTIWYAQPISSYRLVVDVSRPGELRRNAVTVRNGEVIEATVKYRNQNTFFWDATYPLNAEQSYPFTIPGLYDMLRGALNSSNRAEIRVDMRGYPPFPHRIVFGPVWEGGTVFRGTESKVIVREFEILP